MGACDSPGVSTLQCTQNEDVVPCTVLFVLFESAETIYGEYKEFQAVLSRDGRVRWEPGGVFRTMCPIDIRFYPFDEQTCNLIFGAWSYYTTKMNLTADYENGFGLMK